MAKTVLLARPHPFIVSDMKPLLEQSGYAILRPEKVEDVQPLARQSLGAVISLAVTSPLDASAEEVFKLLLQAAPKLPVAFASLLAFERAVGVIKLLAEKSGVVTHIVGVDSSDHSDSLLGKPGTYLYIAKDDLVNPARRQRVSALVTRHFR